MAIKSVAGLSFMGQQKGVEVCGSLNPGQWAETEGTDSGKASWDKGGRGGPENLEAL